MNKRIATMGGLAVLLSTGTILTMALLRTDGYSHLTKAVSELGSLDAPHWQVFNMLGYVLPGLLIGVFAWGLGKNFASEFAHRLPFAMLAASGMLLALSGIFPMDMAHRLAPGSVLHQVGASGSGLAWLLSAFTLGRPLRRNPAWAGMARPLLGLVWATIALIVLVGAVSPATPGLGQRVAFAGYFGFILVLARRLYGAENLALAR